MSVAIKRALLPDGFGLNCSEETSAALRMVGFYVDQVHLSDLFQNPDMLLGYHLLVLGGGFSFGDHLGSGLRLAQQYQCVMGSQLQRYVADGGLIMGICNGFQVLLHLDLVGICDQAEELTPGREVSLTNNVTGRFVDRWVDLEVDSRSNCVFTTGLDTLSLPIRHGEGRIVFAEHAAKRFDTDGLVPLRYTSADNVNGSDYAAAALTNPSGRIFGLMPHPEAAIYPENHPDWRTHRLKGMSTEGLHQGIALFQNAYHAT